MCNLKQKGNRFNSGYGFLFISRAGDMVLTHPNPRACQARMYAERTSE